MDVFFLMLAPLFATGLLSGFMAGLLGVGGGLIIVPIIASLLVWTGVNTVSPMHAAIATSLTIIVPTSVLSAYTHIKLGNVDFGAEELEVLHQLLGLVLGVQDAQLGEDAHVGPL